MGRIIVCITILMLLFPLRRPLFGKGRWILTLPLILLGTGGAILGYLLASASTTLLIPAWIILMLGAVVFIVEGLPVMLGWLIGLFGIFRNMKNDKGHD